MPKAAIKGADLAWMVTATAFVLLMTPALGFFYGGMAGNKNVLNTILMSMVSLGFSLVAWAVVGYSLVFSTGTARLGDLQWALLHGIGLAPGQALSPTITR